MPYADIEQQRAAKAASARRRRADQRGTVVEPDAIAVQPTPQQLREVGVILRVGRAVRESEESYHARLRQSWRDFLLVVEP